MNNQEVNNESTINLFVLSTGFQYYFARLLIPQLGLTNAHWIMFQPREQIEQRAGKDYPVQFADKQDKWTRLFGKKVGKFLFARRALSNLDLKGKSVRVFAPYYNDSVMYVLRSGIEKQAANVEYNMLPDGVALLRHLPAKRRSALTTAFMQWYFGVELADSKHKSGSWSPFLNRIYHFPAKIINCDPEKLELIPVPESDTKNNGAWLVLGGLQGISLEFVREVARRAQGRKVWYRMHPKVKKGVEYIKSETPDWEELQVSGILEEHLLASPYHTVVGYYSSAVVFNHLFIPASHTEFIVDAAVENKDYHETADILGIPVTVL